jgi:hypothetical protein
VLDILKCEMGLEHSRHRSVINAMARAGATHEIGAVDQDPYWNAFSLEDA